MRSKFRRGSCILLATILLISCPITAYASGASVALTAGRYVLSLVFDACGIEFDLSTVSRIIGQWSTYDDYREKGAAGELGLFSQWLYDQGESTQAQDAREQIYAQQRALTDIMNSAWGATVSGVKSLITAIKNWLMTLVGYGSGSTSLTVPVGTFTKDWTTEPYVTTRLCPMRYGSYASRYINNADNEFVMTSYGPSSWAGYAYIRNWYKPKAVEVFGLYKDTGVYLYTKDGKGGYAEYLMFYHYNYMTSAGAYRWTTYDSNHGQIASVPCEERYAGSLPFMVFMTESAMAAYCAEGAISNVYKPGEVALKAENVNADIQNAVLKDIADVIAIPADAAQAQDVLDKASEAMPDESALKTAIREGGLVIDWAPDIDVPDETEKPTDADTEDKTVVGKLSDIIAAVEAIPERIAKKFKEDSTDDKDLDEMSLPKTIISKFPFCVPFDLAYLVETLVAKQEIPKVDIPIKFDYLDFHYNETFVIDFGDYQTVVTIFRIMQDLLFTAGLIVVTRNLIRG